MLDKYFDQLSVGDVFAGTRGRTVTETDIALFSAVSGDWNPLHNDAAFAQTRTQLQGLEARPGDEAWYEVVEEVRRPATQLGAGPIAA